ncbi:MAG: hypothetical protein ACOYLQ_20650 [Hyphomicrobiaceae bacterium]
MGVVLPFRRAIVGSTSRDGDVVIAGDAPAVLADAPNRRRLIAAARPVLAALRASHGIAVMRPGLPGDPTELSRVLLTLTLSRRILDEQAVASHPTWSIGIYFSGRDLGWFSDGYGEMCALRVANSIVAANLADALLIRMGQLAGVEKRA